MNVSKRKIRRPRKKLPKKMPAFKAIETNAIAKARKANFTKAVKAVISSQIEDKTAFMSSGSSLIMCNSGISGSGDMQQVLPGIAQGSGSSNRIGDLIKGKRLKITGFVRLQPNTETLEYQQTTQVMVRLMILTIKIRNGALADALGASPNLAYLLKKGGTTSSFDGNLPDINAPINTDVFTVLAERKFYLSQSLLVQPGAAGISTMATDQRDAVKFFNINIPIKKILRFDSGVSSGTQPTNFAPFLCVGYTFLSGGTPDTISTNVGLQYNTDFVYEDA